MVARLDGDTLALHEEGGGVRVGFDAGETAITSQLIAGQFPDVRQIVPSTWETRVTIERVALAQAVKLGLVFAKDAANVLQLTAGPGSLRVAATSTERGDNTTMLDADVEGAGGEIAFNARYLLDVLQAMDSERVVLDMRDANAPGVWRMDGDDSFAHVLMPMHVQK
jgi:DNA polymerase-3 subunit beta